MPTKIADRLYLFGIFVAIIWVSAFPTWIGQIYDINPDTKLAEYKSGVFGLDGGSPFEKISPIWAPPQASPTLDVAVRMPWQPKNQQYHIEVSVVATFFRLFICSLVLGVMHRIAVALARSENSTIGSIAWSTSLMAIIGCLVLTTIAAFTMGYGLTDQVLWAVMVPLTLTGLTHGILQASMKKPESGVVKSSIASWSRGLGWAVLGMGLGFALMWVTNGIVFSYRPSGWPYAPIDYTGNLLAGGAIISIAWTTAIALWRIVPKSLRNGFLFSATILGVLTCCQF